MKYDQLIISDRMLKHHWQTPIAEGTQRRCTVTPDWYEQNGTPQDDDVEMEYVNTTISLKDMRKFLRMLNPAQLKYVLSLE